MLFIYCINRGDIVGKLDKDYEKYKKRERRSTKKTKHYHDDGKEKKKAPNYFVAIQITNPEVCIIHVNISDLLVVNNLFSGLLAVFIRLQTF